MGKRREAKKLQNIQIFLNLLQNKENVFFCIECKNDNSYQTYHHIYEFLKTNLGIHVCVLDIISIYHSTNIPKLLKSLFLDFVRYVKRNKIPRSIFLLPYYEKWLLPLKESRGDKIENGNIDMPEKNHDNKKRDIHMYIYNAIYYLKNNLLKKLDERYCVKCIGFYNDKIDLYLYNDIFDYNLQIDSFVNTNTPFLYYINVNKEISSKFEKIKNKKHCLNTIYKIASDKIDFPNPHVNLFKCFFEYYRSFIFGHSQKKEREENEDKLLTVNKKQNNKIGRKHFFKLLNTLTNLRYFKCFKTYKYFLKAKKKSASIFLSHHTVINISEYLLQERRFSLSFLKERIDTFLKKHIKKVKKKKNNDVPQDNNTKFDLTNGRNYKNVNGHSIYEESTACYVRKNVHLECKNEMKKITDLKNSLFFRYSKNDKNIYTISRSQKLRKLRKEFIQKMSYPDDHYNIYNTEKQYYMNLYFTKFKIPQSLLIYGTNGIGKSTLLKFIAHIVTSDYLSVFNEIKGTNCSNDKCVTKKSFKEFNKNALSKKHLAHLRKIHRKERKNVSQQFRNVRIIYFESHLLINKCIGENCKYIKHLFSIAFRNQPCIIFFDDIDFFLEKNNHYKFVDDDDDENEDVYKHIYMLLIHYLNSILKKENEIKFVCTSNIHPRYFKFPFLDKLQQIIQIVE